VSSRWAALPIVLAGAGALAPTAGCSHSSPGPTGNRSELLDPQNCKGCHANHYADWSGSMHAYASDDPVFLAMNARGQKETNGALGTFCVNCHAPMAVRDGKTTDGLNLAQLPAEYHGVTCFFCHSVASVDTAHSHDAAVTLSSDLVMRGEYADPVSNGTHASAYSALHDRDHAASAGVCGACHDIVSPAGAPIERTYVEWQASVFATSGGDTCGQCHMQESSTLVPIAQVSGAPDRRYHGHDFPAVDVALTQGFPNVAGETTSVKQFLGTTLQTALCLTQQGGVRVLLDNVAAGHSWPSGAAQDRRAWVEVVASKGGKPFYRSGTVPAGTPVVSVQNDPDLWLLRDCMFDAQSHPVDMFWLAASTEGNELPGQATFDTTDPRYYQTHIVQRFPRQLNAVLSQMPDQVTMQVHVQPIGLDVLDDLVSGGYLDANLAAAMPTWDVTPVLTWTPQTAMLMYQEAGVPVACVSTTGFNVGADKVPATNHMKCSP
jgi:hypothetical protein